jgi:enamine deaminase RidA (YjgF/YER057c/UK114 family)
MISTLNAECAFLKATLVTICPTASSNGAMSLITVHPIPATRPQPATKSGKVVSLTVQPLPGEGLRELCQRIADGLQEHSATPLHLLGFGRRDASAFIMDTLRQTCGRVDWPVTWVEGAGCASQPIAGLQIHAFTGEVERIVCHGRVTASVFTDGGARQCFIGGLLPQNQTLSRAGQTQSTLESLQKTLALAGFDLADTVRTWFFLDKILSWYNDFNQARTQVYAGVKFRTGSLPASTGVGAGNPADAALTVAAWAFRPLGKDSYAEEVASPLQCPAPAYGSSFSRALEISTNTGRRLFVSGTASIAPGGATLWMGDVRRQIELTMEVVAAMLRSRDFSLADLARATAYFRRPEDAHLFSDWQAAHQLTKMPVVSAQCDICRDDLLFELEAEAEAGKP